MSTADVTTGDATVPNTPARAVDSILGSIRVRAQLQQEEHTQEFKVGGEFGELLRIEYKVLDEGPLDNFIARRQNQQSEIKSNGGGVKMTSLTMSFMAQACLCVKGYDESGENSIVLSDSNGPVRLEHRLIEMLGMVPPNKNPQAPPKHLSANEAIMILFGRNAMSIVSHGDDLMEWMQDPSKKPDVGKSSGATGEMSSPSAPSPESTPST